MRRKSNRRTCGVVPSPPTTGMLEAVTLPQLRYTPLTLPKVLHCPFLLRCEDSQGKNLLVKVGSEPVTGYEHWTVLDDLTKVWKRKNIIRWNKWTGQSSGKWDSPFSLELSQDPVIWTFAESKRTSQLSVREICYREPPCSHRVFLCCSSTSISGCVEQVR